MLRTDSAKALYFPPAAWKTDEMFYNILKSDELPNFELQDLLNIFPHCDSLKWNITFQRIFALSDGGLLLSDSVDKNVEACHSATFSSAIVWNLGNYGYDGAMLQSGLYALIVCGELGCEFKISQ